MEVADVGVWNGGVSMEQAEMGLGQAKGLTCVDVEDGGSDEDVLGGGERRAGRRERARAGAGDGQQLSWQTQRSQHQRRQKRARNRLWRFCRDVDEGKKRGRSLSLRPTFLSVAEVTLSAITLTEFANAVKPIVPSSRWPARLGTSAPNPEPSLLLPVLTRSLPAVAVSGGPDSIALLHLLAQHTRHTAARNGLPPVVALTVDHGLRPESAFEAAGVQAFSSSIGTRKPVW